MLGGRLKTVHLAVQGGILARLIKSDKVDLPKQNFELVVRTLYPFVNTIPKPIATIEDAVDNVDIGKVTLLWAAANNHSRVTVVCYPDDFEKMSILWITLDSSRVSQLTLLYGMNSHQNPAQLHSNSE